MTNLKLAFRMLFRTPFVTAVAILSLALGIGANTAIFSLTDQVLFKPLPVPEPGRLVNLSAPGPKSGSISCNQAGDCDEVFSFPMYRDLERGQTVFTGLAGHRAMGVNLAVHGEPMSGEAMLVSGSYFPTLQVAPVLGRLIGPADDATIGTGFVAVLSYAFWNGRFARDPSVIGRSLVVNGRTVTIIGVTPPNFTGTTLGSSPEVFVPLTMRGQLSRFTGFDNRRDYWIYLFGRLKPGVTPDQARAALNGLYTPILTDVEAPLQSGMSDSILARFTHKQIELAPGFRGQSSAHREAQTPLTMLFGVTAVVLLIACANIANLLLARGAGRAQEMGTRLALGASRLRLVRQLLTESVLLALLGGAASLVVARLTMSLLASLLPNFAADTLRFTLQPSVLAFAALLALGTGLVFGLFPALHSTRSELVDAIRAGAGQIPGHRHAGRFRAALVTVQITLATALLISAGLFLKSLVNVSRVDLGVRVDDVVTFAIAPERSGYDTTASAALFRRVEEALARLPGITGVTSAMVPLLAGSNWGTSVYVQGFPNAPDVDNESRFNLVGAGYFRMMGIPVLAGREFTEGDALGGARVAVVNETFARKFKLGQNPVGAFMSNRGPDSLNIEIVGLVKDAKYSDVKDSVPPLFFLPWRQASRIGFLSFYARTPLDPAPQMHGIAATLKDLAPTVPVEGLKPMPDQIRENVFLDRLISILSAVFAALATLLAAVGLYGVLAYTVQQRTREIGVRMALGADARRVRLLVVRQMGVMIILGGTLGVAAALGLGRLLRSLLYRLEGHDPTVFTLSLLALAGVAAAAAYAPVRRASRIDPVQALRYE
jgi:predicted permease